MAISRMLLLCACLLGGLQVALGITISELYPFGPDHGDATLERGDDISSSEIFLQTPIVYYDTTHSSLYINNNGHVSFATEFPPYRSSLVLPIDYELIAIFFSDVDTSRAGYVYHRETTDQRTIQSLAVSIRDHFPDKPDFRPNTALIITWAGVGYYSMRTSETNTFQIVLASDGRDSFAFFHYPQDGLQWVVTPTKGEYASEPGRPGQAGFDAGDGRRSFILPGSGNPDVRRLSEWTNVNIPGVWMFMIGNTRGGDILAPTVSGGGGRPGGLVAESCSTSGLYTCHSDADCVDHRDGFCCRCRQGLIGNGKTCLQPGEAYRVSGKVTGNVNGLMLDEDLHTFVVTKDGRVYLAISKLPPDLGSSMRSMYVLADVLGWLFAVPEDANTVNGFTVTGGEFNRSMRVVFSQSRDRVTIEQESRDGGRRLTTRIDGTVPAISPTANVEVEDYQVVYTRERMGLIRSVTTQHYKVDGQRFSMEVDQTIEYQECASSPLNDLRPQTMTASRLYVIYGEDQEIVRYTMATQVSQGGAVGPGDQCTRLGLRCDPVAQCVPFSNSYMCQCPVGYRGNGQTCENVNECASGLNTCDRNAECLDTPGSFQCRCRSGFAGDGFTCQQESCNTLNNCGTNAQCLYDNRLRRYQCLCNDGYRGDGYRCEADDCRTRRNCHREAQCVTDPRDSRRYTCVCNQGWEGDGFFCQQSAPASGCDVTRDCDVNARCQFDYEARVYKCLCIDGFEGDGKYCTQRPDQGCDRLKNCDSNADCLFDEASRQYQCQCRAGYEGDGLSCGLISDCSRNPQVCDANANCERRGSQSVCVCGSGYRGNGFRCTPLDQRGNFLMLTQGQSLLDMPLTPSASQPGRLVLQIPGQTAVGLDVDCHQRYVYWTDVSGRMIHKAKLDGTDSQDVFRDLGSPEGVAVDWLSRNLYWTDSTRDTVSVGSLDGQHTKVLFNTELVNPRGIQVDPTDGYVFWTDWNRAAPKIERAEMDGSDRQTIVTDGLGLPNGLAIDLQNKQVCWADAKTFKVECVNYDGRGRRVIASQLTYPFGLTMLAGQYYWTDWQTEGVQNTQSGARQLSPPLTVPQGGNGKLYGITVARDRCPRDTNGCAYNNGGCRYLCLPRPFGARQCACPDSMSEDECTQAGLYI